jgi:hypothetical protein
MFQRGQIAEGATAAIMILLALSSVLVPMPVDGVAADEARRLA